MGSTAPNPGSWPRKVEWMRAVPLVAKVTTRCLEGRWHRSRKQLIMPWPSRLAAFWIGEPTLRAWWLWGGGNVRTALDQLWNTLPGKDSSCRAKQNLLELLWQALQEESRARLGHSVRDSPEQLFSLLLSERGVTVQINRL